MVRFSPHLQFLNSAISVLKIVGRLKTFLARSPRSPNFVGRLKHDAFANTGVPSESTLLVPVESSHVLNGNAFVDPPVKSVIATQLVVEPVGKNDPAGQV